MLAPCCSVLPRCQPRLRGQICELSNSINAVFSRPQPFGFRDTFFNMAESGSVGSCWLVLKTHSLKIILKDESSFQRWMEKSYQSAIVFRDLNECIFDDLETK